MFEKTFTKKMGVISFTPEAGSSIRNSFKEHLRKSTEQALKARPPVTPVIRTWNERKQTLSYSTHETPTTTQGAVDTLGVRQNSQTPVSRPAKGNDRVSACVYVRGGGV